MSCGCDSGAILTSWSWTTPDSLAVSDASSLFLAGCLESARAPSASVSTVPMGAWRAGISAPKLHGGIRSNPVPFVPLRSRGGRQQLRGRWIQQRIVPWRRRNWLWKRERQLQHGWCWFMLQPGRGRIWCRGWILLRRGWIWLPGRGI